MTRPYFLQDDTEELIRPGCQVTGDLCMLNTPGKTGQPPKIPVVSSKVPAPDELAVVPMKILKVVGIISTRLKNNVRDVWAIGGDAGELFEGVLVKTDQIEIITSKHGVTEICEELAEYVTVPPAPMEKKLDREADIDGKMLPVYIRARYAVLTVEGVKVEVYGDEQIKVAEWEWGDPLFFTPEYTSIPGGKVPLVPLALKSELHLGLGWLDRVSLISDAVIQKRHTH